MCAGHILEKKAASPNRKKGAFFFIFKEKRVHFLKIFQAFNFMIKSITKSVIGIDKHLRWSFFVKLVSYFSR